MNIRRKTVRSKYYVRNITGDVDSLITNKLRYLKFRFIEFKSSIIHKIFFCESNR